MSYINIKTKQFNISEQDIKSLYPLTSFTAPFVAPDEYALVFPAPQPTYDPITQAVREITPVLTDKGHWEQQWQVQDLDPETIVKNKEEALLSKRSSMVCTPWQIRKALTILNLREAVETAVSQADQQIKDAYEFAQEFKRLDPLVISFGTILEKTDLELDDLFTLAMSL